jgi:SAM-dependent methyltransferase
MGGRWLQETRDSYDTVAASYAALLADELAGATWDRASLGAFAEPLGPGARVLEVGCGPGRVTAHLAGLGLAATGIDLSPGMVAEARRRHPGLPFAVANLLELPVEDGALDGVVAWYSLIHLPPDRLPAAVAELARVLRPGGRLLTAFQVGDQQLRLDSGYGHEIAMDVWRLDPDRLGTLLESAGLEVTTRVVCARRPPAKTPQAHLHAEKVTR